MPGSNGFADPAAVTASVEFGKIVTLLGSLLAEARAEVQELGVSDAPGRELTLEHWPAVGSKRTVVERTGNGYDGLAVSTTGVLLVPANEARIGSTWINSGANPIIIYLASYAKKGAPAVWLAANGGAWDGRFGNLPWCGNLFAVAQTTASTIVGGEL